jgi:hypothetical protein
MATVCNATIHRFLFVSDLIAPGYNKISKTFVNSLMVFLQIVWPLIAAIMAAQVDMKPHHVIEESKKVGVCFCLDLGLPYRCKFKPKNSSSIPTFSTAPRTSHVFSS